MEVTKLICVGDCQSGKTSLMLSYQDNMFTFVYHLPNLWDGLRIIVSLSGIPADLFILDTVAHSDYDRLRPLAYPHTEIFFITFSSICPASLENAQSKWFAEIKHHCPDAMIFLVATKIDLRNDVVVLEKLKEKKLVPVSSDEGATLAKKLGIRYFETSALTGKGVRDVFEAAILTVQKGQKISKKCVIC